MTHQVAQAYTNYLNQIMKAEASFFRVSADDEKPEMWVLFYPETPQPGHLTAFTFGLSEVEHPAWQESKPELTLCVESQETDWALALGHVAKAHRGTMPYSLGTVFDFEGPIATDTKMSGFLLHEALLLPEEASKKIKFSDRTIHWVGAYPLYQQEINRINLLGLELFFTGEHYDPYSVTRPERGENLEAS